MQSSVYEQEHEDFRQTVRAFLTKEAAPVYDEWIEAGTAPRDFWRRAGDLGLLCFQAPQEYEGPGSDDFRFNAVLTEEMEALGISYGGLRVQNDVVLPYLLRYATDEQRRRWLPGMVGGELVTAIAMSEPGTGSDISGITTSAVRDGDHYVVNGSKTFISNGTHADLVITAVRTDPKQRYGGLTLLMVETTAGGFSRGGNLKKIGQSTQDTCELFFDDLRVPVADRLGAEGRAFDYLTSNLPQERLSIAVAAQSGAEAALERTIGYVRERTAFGNRLSDFQNTKFVLAESAAELRAGRALLDQSLLAHVRGELDAAEAAVVKLFCTETQGRVVDRCLQLHGGYGYLHEYPIARSWTDARVNRIFGGSSEIMKSIIANSLDL
ncbi:acyl-CoA dehydrogenase family protein [Streptomyces sp. NPDC001985]|uniref:acyl-CoA dehydrogenase family protein n=1 Tax=Streptomyces sp. NPDC001985 TaxID=3154406 RepID=UPI00331F2F91